MKLGNAGEAFFVEPTKVNFYLFKIQFYILFKFPKFILKKIGIFGF